MCYKKHLSQIKQRLQHQYLNLIEVSDNYRFIDESVSDIAAYKAMKLLQKLSKVSYLQRESTV